MTTERIGLYIRSATGDLAHIKKQKLQLNAVVKEICKNSGSKKTTEIFIDEIASGMSINRPGLNKLLRAIDRKEIDLILVTDLARLSRSVTMLKDLFQHLAFHGCDLLSIQQNFSSSKDAFVKWQESRCVA